METIRSLPPSSSKTGCYNTEERPCSEMEHVPKLRNPNRCDCSAVAVGWRRTEFLALVVRECDVQLTGEGRNVLLSCDAAWEATFLMRRSWHSGYSAANVSDKMARNWRKVFKGFQFPKKLCPEDLIKVQTLHVVIVLLYLVSECAN
jgi:hypothetical protein